MTTTFTLRHKLNFRITPRQPFCFELTIRKPAGWHWFTPFELWTEGIIRTGFWFRLHSGKKIPIGLRACEDGQDVLIAIYTATSLDKDTVSRLRAMMIKALGAHEDIRPLYTMMRSHPILKHLMKRLYGMHEAWGSDIFPSLTLAVLLQMAPIKRSQEMWHCLIEKYGDKISFDNVSLLLWPTEEKIAQQPWEDLAECKLGYRAKTLVRLARQMVQGFPNMEELSDLSPQQAKEKLMELFGIGEYSASFATPHQSFSLDVWSVKIMHRLIFGKPPPLKDPRAAIEKTSRAAERLWKNWRGYILTYVLNDLPYLKKRFGIYA
ncbi:MAG: hypothetical protein ABSH12_06490 [Endomicrobiales bacterium]|jgi:3-methyladenine DNA glycosylase/8-oxoguanine DNA glycosylase